MRSAGASESGGASEPAGSSETPGAGETTGAPETTGAAETNGAAEPAGPTDAAGAPDPARAHRIAEVPGPRPEAEATVPDSGAHNGAHNGADGGPTAGGAGSGPLSVVVTDTFPEPRGGVAALSFRYRIAAALAVAVVSVVVFVHIGMVFLHVAPSNTLTKAHGKAIDDWIYPEFEQNWKLFAPNPLQQNIAVQVRAEVKTADGGVRTTGWYDLSAEDGRAIDANPVPSHTQQNELRRAWDFFVATHDASNRATGTRGSLAETYMRRIVVLRLDRDDAAGKGGTITQVQVRSSTTNVPPPPWSTERVSNQPMYRMLPWWPVTAADTAGGAE
ncbi:DUF5819 family protein [Streptomyces sp. MBT33]|uniref:DUF5819 family protein n=1 Tax=Streptomyces sp. MBT33 TaxID=1488363 RepID=UPI001F27A409|nr:DUF5819 family protein [Streptomyces sp. MBT33]